MPHVLVWRRWDRLAVPPPTGNFRLLPLSYRYLDCKSCVELYTNLFKIGGKPRVRAFTTKLKKMREKSPVGIHLARRSKNFSVMSSASIKWVNKRLGPLSCPLID